MSGRTPRRAGAGLAYPKLFFLSFPVLFAKILDLVYSHLRVWQLPVTPTYQFFASFELLLTHVLLYSLPMHIYMSNTTLSFF